MRTIIVIAVAALLIAPVGTFAQQRRVTSDLPHVYIEASETVDASNSKDKAKNVDFGSAIAAALMKKEVPVMVVTDQNKAQWNIRSVSSQKEDSTGTKVAKLAFGGLGGGFTKFEGTIQVIDIESSAVLYAYNVKKGNFQSAAEAFAKHFKGDYLKK
jgi:polyisoprenoid-binding protein YceI